MFDFPTEITTCPNCGAECQSIRIGSRTLYECDPCANAETARRRTLERRRECLALWERCTPEMFQEAIRPELLESYLIPALSLPGTQGAGFIGPSGGGKTRVAYALLRKAALAGLRPYAVNGSRLRQAASQRYQEGDGSAREILSAARHAGALLIDDVGKGSSTETGDEAVYDLLDHRRGHKKVTFWTSNGDGKWIAARFGFDRGPAIALRLAHLADCTAKGDGRIFTPGTSPANEHSKATAEPGNSPETSR